MRIGGASPVTQYVNRCQHAASGLLSQPQPGLAGGALHFKPLHLPLGPFRTAGAGFPPTPPPAGGPDDDGDDGDGRGHFPWESIAAGVALAGLALLVASCGAEDSEKGSADASGPSDATGGSFDSLGKADVSENAVDTTDALADAPDTEVPSEVAPPDIDATIPTPDAGPDIPDTVPPPVDATPDVQPVPDTVDDDADGTTDATIDEPDTPVAPDLTAPDVPPAEDLAAADDIAAVVDTAQPDTPVTPDTPIIVEDTSDMTDTADAEVAPPPDAYFTDFICKTLVAYGIDTVSGNPLPKGDFLSTLFTKPTPNTQLAVQFDIVDKPANAFVYEVALCYQTKVIAPTTVDPALTDANGKLISIPHCDSKTWATPLGLPLKPANVTAIEHQYTAPPPTKYAEWKLLTTLTTTLFSGLLFAQDPVVAVQVVLQPEPGQYCFYGFSSGICDNPPPKCP